MATALLKNSAVLIKNSAGYLCDSCAHFVDSARVFQPGDFRSRLADAVARNRDMPQRIVSHATALKAINLNTFNPLNRLKRISLPEVNRANLMALCTRVAAGACACNAELQQRIVKMQPKWWHEYKVIKMSEALTPARVALLQKNLLEAGLLDEDAPAAQPFRGLRILDVGCGNGCLTQALAARGANVTGIDPCSIFIDIARERQERTPLFDEQKLEYVVTTVEDFAAQNKEKYDVIVSSEVIEHVTDKDRFAKSILHCLRTGGSAFFTTTNRTAVSGLYYIAFGSKMLKAIPPGTLKFSNFMRPSELAGLFRKYNCITTNVDGFTLNVFSGKSYRMDSFPYLNFALHAKKQKSFYY